MFAKHVKIISMMSIISDCLYQGSLVAAIIRFMLLLMTIIDMRYLIVGLSLAHFQRVGRLSNLINLKGENFYIKCVYLQFNFSFLKNKKLLSRFTSCSHRPQ